MKSVYIINWVDLDINSNEKVCFGFSGAYTTLENAKEQLNKIFEEEKYRLDDTNYETIKEDEYLKIIFDYDNYLEYQINKIDIVK